MKYNCPICNAELREQFGDHLHPGDPKHGVKLDCINPVCPPQEVMGHGDKAADAFKVICDRFSVHIKENKQTTKT